MISLDRAREILATDGIEMPDDQITALVEDLYAVGRVIVASYRKPAQKPSLAGSSRFSGDDHR